MCHVLGHFGIWIALTKRVSGTRPEKIFWVSRVKIPEIPSPSTLYNSRQHIASGSGIVGLRVRIQSFPTWPCVDVGLPYMGVNQLYPKTVWNQAILVKFKLFGDDSQWTAMGIVTNITLLTIKSFISLRIYILTNLILCMRQAWADDSSKMSQNCQKCQNCGISWQYLASSWEIHSNKYKHAWFWFIDSWNRH